MGAGSLQLPFVCLNAVFDKYDAIWPFHEAVTIAEGYQAHIQLRNFKVVFSNIMVCMV